MDVVEDILKHYGVKGMKWGVRKDDSTPKTKSSTTQTKDVSSDAAKAQASGSKAKSKGTQSLSTQEMRDLVNRMQLEQQYAQMMQKEKEGTALYKGKKFVGDTVLGLGKNVLDTQTKRIANHLIGKALDDALGINKKK